MTPREQWEALRDALDRMDVIDWSLVASQPPWVDDLLRNAAPALLASARHLVEVHRPLPLTRQTACHGCPLPWPCSGIAPLLPLIGGDQ